MDITKTTFNLPTEELEALKRLANRRGITATHALRQAIQTELYVQRVTDADKDVLVRSPDGLLEQVVFTQTITELNRDVDRQRERETADAETRAGLGSQSR